MLNKRFSELVEECLQRLDQGEDLIAVLADFPQKQSELKQLLLVAMSSRAFPMPFPDQLARQLGKNSLLEKMEKLGQKNAFRKTAQIPTFARISSNVVGFIRSFGLTRPSPNFRIGMVALVMMFGAGFLTMNASASNFSGGVFDYFLGGYKNVVQSLTFFQNEAGELEFGQFQFFNDGSLSFGNKVGNKAVFLLNSNSDRNHQYGYGYGYGQGDGNGQSNGNAGFTGGGASTYVGNNGLHLGQDPQAKADYMADKAAEKAAADAAKAAEKAAADAAKAAEKAAADAAKAAEKAAKDAAKAAADAAKEAEKVAKDAAKEAVKDAKDEDKDKDK